MRPSLKDIVKRLEDTIADLKSEKHKLKVSSDGELDGISENHASTIFDINRPLSSFTSSKSQ